MDLRQLRYFVTTAEEGSANRAAQRLHVTQPVLSRQLRQLERQTGLRLFERDGRRLRLTHVGEAFAARARRVLGEAKALEDAVASWSSGGLEKMHIAVPATTLSDVLAPFLATLGPDDPMPLLRTLAPGRTTDAIANGADLAIGHQPPPPELAGDCIAVLPVLAYVRATDDWAGRKSVTLPELITQPLLLLPPETRPRVLLDTAIDAARLHYDQVLECSDAQVALALTAAGRGVAVVSDDPNFDLVPLGIETESGPLQIRLYAAWDPRHHAAGRLAEIADRLAKFCVTKYGPQVSPH